jgi:hypothetical protein
LTAVRSLGQVALSDDGTFEIETSPTINTKYFAEVGDGGDCPALSSKRKLVKVGPEIRISKLRQCRAVSGRVAPNQWGTDVRLQRRAPKRWNTVDRDRLNRHSWFKLEFPTCRGPYRILWQSAPSHLAKTWRRI